MNSVLDQPVPNPNGPEPLFPPRPPSPLPSPPSIPPTALGIIAPIVSAPGSSTSLCAASELATDGGSVSGTKLVDAAAGFDPEGGLGDPGREPGAIPSSPIPGAPILSPTAATTSTRGGSFFFVASEFPPHNSSSRMAACRSQDALPEMRKRRRMDRLRHIQ